MQANGALEKVRGMVLCAAVAAAVVGCLGVDSSHNVSEYANVGSVDAFAGDYENLGRPGGSDEPSYLSALIWRNDSKLKHGKIRTVHVRSAGRRKLLVRGLDAEGYEIQSALFEEGSDFRLWGGVIRIDSRTRGDAFGMYPMGPFAAVTRESVLLGLDREGNAQQVTSRSTGGVWIVVPFVGTEAQGKTFRRVKEVPVAAGVSRLLHSYPVRPVEIRAVDYTSVPDVIARTLKRKLTERWGERVIVVNALVDDPMDVRLNDTPPTRDGHALLFHRTYALSAAVQPKLQYDPYKDFVPVAPLLREPTVLLVGGRSAAQSIAHLIASAKTKAGGLSFGSDGVGTARHLDAEKLRIDAGIEARHVPYPFIHYATDATLAGQVDFSFNTVADALGSIRAGRLRALAVSGARRQEALPDVPTLAEAGLSAFNYSLWSGLWAPAGVPAEVVEKIAHDVASVLAEPEVRQEIAKLGAEPMVMSRTEFARFVRKEMDDSFHVARTAGMTRPR